MNQRGMHDLDLMTICACATPCMPLGCVTPGGETSIYAFPTVHAKPELKRLMRKAARLRILS